MNLVRVSSKLVTKIIVLAATYFIVGQRIRSLMGEIAHIVVKA